MCVLLTFTVKYNKYQLKTNFVACVLSWTGFLVQDVLSLCVGLWACGLETQWWHHDEAPIYITSIVAHTHTMREREMFVCLMYIWGLLHNGQMWTFTHKLLLHKTSLSVCVSVLRFLSLTISLVFLHFSFHHFAISIASYGVLFIFISFLLFSPNWPDYFSRLNTCPWSDISQH